jgi:hypothetical protein
MQGYARSHLLKHLLHVEQAELASAVLLQRVQLAGGEPWYVCGVLELSDPSMTGRRLDDDEKGASTMVAHQR